MKITNNTPIQVLRYQAGNKPEVSTAGLDNSELSNSYGDVKYSQIAFGAIYNVKLKKIDIEIEKNKLLKQISEILNTDSPEMDFGEFFVSAFKKTIGYIRGLEKRKWKILEELDELNADKSMNRQQKINKANKLKKEYKAIKNSRLNPIEYKMPDKADDGLDFSLLNKFKTAISEDNFELRKIFKDYYKGLNDVKSLDELAEMYPDIKIPAYPEDVIARKIENTLTRDFYENLDDFMDAGNVDSINKFLESAIKSRVTELADKYNFDAEALYLRVGLQTGQEILARYQKIKLSDGFSSIPEQRKIKTPQLSDNDIYLLAVDYDDFVLSILRKQYLDGEKLSELAYSDENTFIPVSAIKDSCYKFEKIPEKINKMLVTADNLKAAQRDYDNFNVQQLKNRLAFFANSELGNEEEVLEKIISFYSCNFAPGDISSLVKFMRELDLVKDGQKTLNESLETIQKEGLRPHETERLNALELQKKAEKIKLEQKKVFELNTLKNKFDDSVNILYKNNMNSIASTCSKYRPLSLETRDMDEANYVINLIQNNLSKDGKIINKNKLESAIMRWDTYNYYKNSDIKNEIFERASYLARDSKGNVDINRAGQYIMNYEIVDNYPGSKNLVRNPEILEKIMDKAATKELAIKYLCKYDNYTDLSPLEKTKISNFVEMFDLKDSLDKLILKDIVENDYAKCDTIVQTILNDKGAETIDAAICSSAKEQIIEKYKFPTCLEFLKGFEDALSSTAGNRGVSGIKKTGQNNKTLEYKMELKLMGHDDRLFSSKNDYRFDIFSSTGLH